MLIIPTQPVPSQTLQASLNNQPCTINLYQSPYGLFLDLLINGGLIIGGVICWNLNLCVRNAYLGFVGDLMVGDTQGNSDPVYTGLGTRYQLAYLTPADVVASGVKDVG